MKLLKVISDEKSAHLFSDYLLSGGVENQIDKCDSGWELWVYDEDKMSEARKELESYLKAPHADKYRVSSKSAQKIKASKLKENKKKNKLYVDVRVSSSGSQRAPLTWWLITISVLIFFLKEFGKNEAVEEVLFKLFIDDPSYGTPVLWRVRAGEFWRLVTPVFLHFGFMHILFNMMWLHSLGGIIEEKKGKWKYLMIFLSIAVFSNLAQYFYGGPNFGGMSGVVFGLLGYVWMKMKFQAHENILIDPMNINFMLIWLVVCMTGMVGPIANAAHLGGLVAGVILGFIPYLLKSRK